MLLTAELESRQKLSASGNSSQISLGDKRDQNYLVVLVDFLETEKLLWRYILHQVLVHGVSLLCFQIHLYHLF